MAMVLYLLLVDRSINIKINYAELLGSHDSKEHKELKSKAGKIARE